MWNVSGWISEVNMDAEEIYRQYSGKIAAYIRSRITSHSIAEDLHSEIFLKICSKKRILMKARLRFPHGFSP
ncbi:MAG: hypothetical protein ACI4KR_08860 [Ruminiclostridium sp.]